LSVQVQKNRPGAFPKQADDFAPDLRQSKCCPQRLLQGRVDTGYAWQCLTHTFQTHLGRRMGAELTRVVIAGLQHWISTRAAK
jgi:hypothetical protein